MDGSVAIGIGIGLGLAALGTGIGQGLGVNGAVQGIARQPEANSRIFTAMIIGLALIESLLIFCWVVLNGLAAKVPTPEQQKSTSAIVRPAPKSYAMAIESRGTYTVR
jgi:F-type H+-transporting ATPase subunit c